MPKGFGTIADQIQAKIDDLAKQIKVIDEQLNGKMHTAKSKDELWQERALTEKKLLELALMLDNSSAMAKQAAGPKAI